MEFVSLQSRRFSVLVTNSDVDVFSALSFLVLGGNVDSGINVDPKWYCIVTFLWEEAVENYLHPEGFFQRLKGVKVLRLACSQLIIFLSFGLP